MTAAKYLQALDDGVIPLELLFSGTVFHAGEDGRLRAGRISWESEARYELPVRVWREVMDRYFHGTAWIRLERDAFDALNAYRARHALPTWERAVEHLLDAAGEDADG